MKKWWWVGLVILFLFLRLYNLDGRMDFSMDQGRDCIRALEIWKNKEITLIGPTASPKYLGHNFFHGPIGYYSIVGLMLLANWDPLVAGWILVGLNLGGAVVLWLVIKKVVNERAAWMGIMVYTAWPLAINYSNFIWNPNFLLILTPIYLYFLINIYCKNTWRWALAGGVIGGVGLQYHYQFGLILVLSGLILMYKKVGWQKLEMWMAGVIVGYSPLLLFDLRNDFYNIRTIVGWLRFGGDDKFGLQPYYFLAWIPIIILILSKYLVKYRALAVGGLVILAVTTTWSVINQKQAYGMPQNWGYADLIETEKIVIANNGASKFNIANLISGDTRFYSLRYLLIRDGVEPSGVENYGSQTKLWVISDKNKSEVVNYPVWEINSMEGRRVEREWQINEKVRLYLVTSLENGKK